LCVFPAPAFATPRFLDTHRPENSRLTADSVVSEVLLQAIARLRPPCREFEALRMLCASLVPQSAPQNEHQQTKRPKSVLKHTPRV
jgi:hypothetical protein